MIGVMLALGDLPEWVWMVFYAYCPTHIFGIVLARLFTNSRKLG